MKVSEDVVRSITKPSDVLRLAAEELAERTTGESTGCCAVLHGFERIVGYTTKKARVVRRAKKLFTSLYSPWEYTKNPKDRGQMQAYWFGYPTNENKHHRISALLIAAAMAESVGE